MKGESASRRFQPGEGPSRGLLRDYEPLDGPSFQALPPGGETPLREDADLQPDPDQGGGGRVRGLPGAVRRGLGGPPADPEGRHNNSAGSQ